MSLLTLNILFRSLHEETYIRPCRFPNLIMRYHLSDVEFGEPTNIGFCQNFIHLVINKYYLCKIIDLFFEYSCELVICCFDFVRVDVVVFGKVHVR